MKHGMLIAAIAVVCLAANASGFEKKAFQARDDFETVVIDDCFLQYYYFIPCPTYSWFWGYYGWVQGETIGEFFTIGDNSMAGYTTCDSSACQHIFGFRVLDFAGYGAIYPGMFTVKFNIYCCDAMGCPVGPPLWESLPVETQRDWTSFMVEPPVCVTDCCVQPAPPVSPRILLTATHIGTDCTYPQWGMDNISAVVENACAMHDAGCLPALYPRPSSSHYATIHSGYYGINFAECPPVWFADGADTVPGAPTYGYVELAWRLFVRCLGPATEPTTWGQIKAIYK